MKHVGSDKQGVGSKSAMASIYKPARYRSGCFSRNDKPAVIGKSWQASIRLFQRLTPFSIFVASQGSRGTHGFPPPRSPAPIYLFFHFLSLSPPSSSLLPRGLRDSYRHELSTPSHACFTILKKLSFFSAFDKSLPQHSSSETLYLRYSILIFIIDTIPVTQEQSSLFYLLVLQVKDSASVRSWAQDVLRILIISHLHYLCILITIRTLDWTCHQR
jgi:hypothetical protein